MSNEEEDRQTLLEEPLLAAIPTDDLSILLLYLVFNFSGGIVPSIDEAADFNYQDYVIVTTSSGGRRVALKAELKYLEYGETAAEVGGKEWKIQNPTNKENNNG